MADMNSVPWAPSAALDNQADTIDDEQWRIVFRVKEFYARMAERGLKFPSGDVDTTH